MRSPSVGSLALLLALHASSAGACGYCIEDRVASVYDHEVVTAALARNHRVAFLAIEGPLAHDEGTRAALAALVESTPGVDKGSARVSVGSATLSFGFGPRRASLARVMSSLETALHKKGLSLLPLQVMDRSVIGRRAKD